MRFSFRNRPRLSDAAVPVFVRKLTPDQRVVGPLTSGTKRKLLWRRAGNVVDVVFRHDTEDLPGRYGCLTLSKSEVLALASSFEDTTDANGQR